MRAIRNDTVIAESADTVVVEGNHYFPPDAIDSEYFKPSDTTSVCPWKGTASYYTVEVAGEQNPDAALVLIVFIRERRRPQGSEEQLAREETTEP